MAVQVRQKIPLGRLFLGTPHGACALPVPGYQGAAGYSAAGKSPAQAKGGSGGLPLMMTSRIQSMKPDCFPKYETKIYL